MSARDEIFAAVRGALGRDRSAPPPPAPSPWTSASEPPGDAIVQRFVENIAALGATALVVGSTAEAREAAAAWIGDRSAIISEAPVLKEIGLSDLPAVQRAPGDAADLKDACVRAQVGVTSCAYALAETGSLVQLSSDDEPRMISLLPPAHLAILPKERVLFGMDELLGRIPNPAAASSSMVLITGPSRTADIEQILVKGVHGPAELAVILF